MWENYQMRHIGVQRKVQQRHELCSHYWQACWVEEAKRLPISSKSGPVRQHSFLRKALAGIGVIGEQSPV